MLEDLRGMTASIRASKACAARCELSGQCQRAFRSAPVDDRRPGPVFFWSRAR